MSDAYTSRRRDQRRIKDADQTELEAILHGTALVDQGVYDDRVADALDDFEPDAAGGGSDWQRQDLKIDSAVGQVHEEVERRVGLLREAYPFTLQGGLLTYCRSRSGFYEFCLAISLADQITSGKHVDLPRTFERLSAILVRRFLGESALSLHLGTPRDPGTGSRFGEAMRKAHNETKEWIWGPNPELPLDPSDSGDHGVDFVAWLSPPDGRVGSLFVLGQCACGDDWTGKFGDVDLARFGKWFNPLSYVTPVRAFATPHHVSEGWLHEALQQAGLVFDRARFAILAEQACEHAEYRSWAGRVAELTRLVVPLPSAA